MTVALLQALAIALGGLSSMGTVLIVLLLLDSKAGVRAALAFAGGYLSSYAVIGGVALVVGRGVAQTDDPGASPAQAGLFTLLGLLLAVAAIRQWRKPAAAPDAAPSPMLAKIDSCSVARALGFGLAIPALNFKNLSIYLSAIAVLAAAPLGRVEAAACVLLTDLVFCSAMLSPLLIYGLVPTRSQAALARMRAWIEANSSTVVRMILTLLALVFLAKGAHEGWALTH